MAVGHGCYWDERGAPPRLRQPGNNSLCIYGQELEDFSRSCKNLMDRLKHILPEGCPRTRIRATSRVTRKMESGVLSETLGDESRGTAEVRNVQHRSPPVALFWRAPGFLLCFAVRMIVLDFHGCPQKYDQLKIMSDVVAKERVDGGFHLPTMCSAHRPWELCKAGVR